MCTIIYFFSSCAAVSIGVKNIRTQFCMLRNGGFVVFCLYRSNGTGIVVEDNEPDTVSYSSG